MLNIIIIIIIEITWDKDIHIMSMGFRVVCDALYIAEVS